MMRKQRVKKYEVLKYIHTISPFNSDRVLHSNNNVLRVQVESMNCELESDVWRRCLLCSSTTTSTTTITTLTVGMWSGTRQQSIQHTDASRMLQQRSILSHFTPPQPDIHWVDSTVRHSSRGRENERGRRVEWEGYIICQCQPVYESCAMQIWGFFLLVCMCVLGLCISFSLTMFIFAGIFAVSH